MPEFHDQYKNYPKNAWWHLATDMLNGGYYYFSILRLEPKSILEVGAGSGKTSVLLKRLLPEIRIVATDSDPECCNIIREFARVSNVDVEVERADCRSLPFNDNEFDVCHSGGVIEHLKAEDIPIAIKEHIRVAKAAVVEVPLLHWFLRGMSQQNDEVILPKTDWLRIFGMLANVVDFSLDGPKGEELTMTCLMTKEKEYPLRLSTDTVLNFRKE